MENEVRRDSLRAWVLAARPKTLAAALAPVLAGCALAAWAGGFKCVPALLCGIFAILMQIASNFINDVYDFLEGNDREDRLGPKRACAQGWISPQKMKRGIALVLALALAAGCPLAWYGGPPMLAVAAVCLACAYMYSAGPYPLAAHGWGDVLVLVFFGIVPVGFTCYVQLGEWIPQATFSGLAVGVCVNLLLTVNNFRDRDQDRISGKKTLIARFGAAFGLRYYFVQGALACALALCLVPHGMFWAGVLPMLFLIPHFRLWKEIAAVYEGRALNRCLGLTSRNILIFSALLSAGIFIDAIMKFSA